MASTKTEYGCGIMLALLIVSIILSLSLPKRCSHRQEPQRTKKSNVHSTSTDREREIKQLVISSTGDSVFHYSTMCSKLGRSPEISNEYLERISGKWMCTECALKEIEYSHHKDEIWEDYYRMEKEELDMMDSIK